jgi:hypothetical protein
MSAPQQFFDSTNNALDLFRRHVDEWPNGFSEETRSRLQNDEHNTVEGCKLALG